MIKTKQHFTSLEWLRLCLGVYIVLFHTFHFKELPGWVNKLTEMGFFATSTFFVLSGFLLAHVYLKREGANEISLRESPKSFLVKRFANLYPIHIFSLLTTLIIVSILPILMISPNDGEASIRFVMYDANNFADGASLKHYMSNWEMALAFVMNFTLTQSLNPYYLTFNAPAWTVSTLFFLYLTFPFLATRLSKIKSPMKALLIVNALYLLPVIAAIMYSDFGMPITGILHRNPLIRLPEFVAGILLCSMYHQQASTGFRPSKLLKAALGLLVIASLVGGSYLLKIAPDLNEKGNVAYYLLHDGLLLPAQLALIYLFIHMSSPTNKWVLNASQRLGNSTLPMFAFHIPLYIIFARLQRYILGEPTAWAYPLFLMALIVFCIYFQEQVVTASRRAIQSVFLPAKT